MAASFVIHHDSFKVDLFDLEDFDGERHLKSRVGEKGNLQKRATENRLEETEIKKLESFWGFYKLNISFCLSIFPQPFRLVFF